MLITKLMIAATPVLLVPLALRGAEISGAESATHGDEAAQYQVVDIRGAVNVPLADLAD